MGGRAAAARRPRRAGQGSGGGDLREPSRTLHHRQPRPLRARDQALSGPDRDGLSYLLDAASRRGYGQDHELDAAVRERSDAARQKLIKEVHRQCAAGSISIATWASPSATTCWAVRTK